MNAEGPPDSSADSRKDSVQSDSTPSTDPNSRTSPFANGQSISPTTEPEEDEKVPREAPVTITTQITYGDVTITVCDVQVNETYVEEEEEEELIPSSKALGKRPAPGPALEEEPVTINTQINSGDLTVIIANAEDDEKERINSTSLRGGSGGSEDVEMADYADTESEDGSQFNNTISELANTKLASNTSGRPQLGGLRPSARAVSSPSLKNSLGSRDISLGLAANLMESSRSDRSRDEAFSHHLTPPARGVTAGRRRQRQSYNYQYSTPVGRVTAEELVRREMSHTTSSDRIPAQPRAECYPAASAYGRDSASQFGGSFRQPSGLCDFSAFSRNGATNRELQRQQRPHVASGDSYHSSRESERTPMIPRPTAFIDGNPVPNRRRSKSGVKRPAEQLLEQVPGKKVKRSRSDPLDHYRCERCRMTFLRSGHLINHLRRVHPEQHV